MIMATVPRQQKIRIKHWWNIWGTYTEVFNAAVSWTCKIKILESAPQLANVESSIHSTSRQQSKRLVGKNKIESKTKREISPLCARHCLCSFFSFTSQTHDVPSRLPVKSHRPDFENRVANIGPFSRTNSVQYKKNHELTCEKEGSPDAGNARNRVYRRLS
jgi:hypothetical protein